MESFKKGENLGVSSNERRVSVLITLNFSMLYLYRQFAVNSNVGKIEKGISVITGDFRWLWSHI